MIKWPSQKEVEAKLREWLAYEIPRHFGVIAVGTFGSFVSQEKWGPGSDLDLIILVKSAEKPWNERGSAWDTLSLPVPVDLMIYTDAEWKQMKARGDRIVEEIAREAVWFYGELP